MVVLAGDRRVAARIATSSFTLRPVHRPSLVLAVALLVAMVGTGCGLFDHNDNDATYIFGDSLTAFASSYVSLAVHDANLKLVVKAYPGLAPCDIQREATRLLRDEHPKAMLLEFAGNNATPCVHGLTGPALAAAYDKSVRAIAKVANEQDVPLVLLGPPAMHAPRWVTDSPLISRKYQKIAGDTDGVSFVSIGTTLSPNGWTLRLPCLNSETKSMGCIDGTIRVRNFDGVHWDDPGADGYSSGSFRYAQVVIGAAKDAA
jgi:hypothetical protein